MATATNDMTTIQGWFKIAYADKIASLQPDMTYYAKEIPNVEASKEPGLSYNEAVNLTLEQGITLAPADAGAFALESPIALNSQQATIKGTQLLLRSAMDYETIFRSKNQNAFIRATRGIIENMVKSAYLYQEMLMMWGGQGIGTVSAVSGNTVTITEAEFAPGLWLGSENRKLRFESSAGVLRGTANVSSYSISDRTVTVDSLPSGVTATDVIWLGSAGASGANEMTGIYKIVNHTSGSLFGINASSYNLWQSAGTYSAGSAPLSFDKIMKGVAQAVNHGAGYDIREFELVVNPNTFADLGNDEAALREYDAKYSPSEAMRGQEQITFYSQAGKLSIMAHPMQKKGYAWLHPKCSRSFRKIGAQPSPTFELPGMVNGNGGKQYLRSLENNAGVESRIYWNTSVFTTKQHQMLLFNNITNES